MRMGCTTCPSTSLLLNNYVVQYFCQTSIFLNKLKLKVVLYDKNYSWKCLYNLCEDVYSFFDELLKQNLKKS